MDHLQGIFIAEAEELIASLEETLLQFDKDRTNKTSVETIFRSMHTLKGSASMFGFESLSALTHELETVYDLIRTGRFAATNEVLEVTLETVDHVKKIIRDQGMQDPANRARHEALHKAIAGLTGEQTHTPTGMATFYVHCKPHADVLLKGTNPLYLMEDLVSLGTARVLPHMDEVPKLGILEPTLCYTGFEVFLASKNTLAEVEGVFIFAEDCCEVMVEKISDTDLLQVPAFTQALDIKPFGASPFGLPAIQHLVATALRADTPLTTAHTAVDTTAPIPSAAAKNHVTSIRVSSDKLDELLNLVSELVTSQAGLTLLAGRHNIPDLANLAENMEKISRRLRENAFSICLIPIDTLVTRFQRLVRDLSKELGKEINFSAEGVETELDKSIIENITDPILHMLRNCIDHGIESPAEREAKGKPRQGSIRMKAFHSGTSVYIQIVDDGKGIDAEKIRQKAIAKGLIAADAVLSEKETYDLIFKPGFSTAEQVTDVSGRGVGMDIVKRNIEAIHGEVSIASRVQEGTTITIRLPLTLSIVDGMRVRIASSEYILPLTAVDKCYEIETRKLRQEHAQKIEFDGALLPVFNLREVFHDDEPKPDITQVIKVHFDEFPVGLAVDAVIGEYQAVMKPLGSFYENREEFSGATILGDGSVALVMDIHKLVRQLIDENRLLHQH
ncbi:chemotaxis protein CheA [Parachryseolinea silvisoli]|uniref:chemotaxis protein CheA n=1 Tax=Parachryseolinea silvisoli TaxID=2873601 RepID=UPI002265B358|nr:chemotaxis protein CheA [Parachryseolinea silvisoli]MCD9015797.1 chemotaxis protein CheA [Parachryseolinea silvisoli]